MYKQAIGVIGHGVVGKAIAERVKEVIIDISIYDAFKELYNTAEHLENVLKTALVFICVPTPSNKDRKQEIDALLDVLTILNHHNYKGVAVIKCTVLPGTCRRLSTQFPHLKLVHNPEFVTEKRALIDLREAKHHILSSNDKIALYFASVLLKKLFPEAQIHSSSNFEETEFAKYLHNTFLATKVVFMHEFALLCAEKNTLFSAVVALAQTQGKIGESHLRAPGENGEWGYGGMCFPKDVLAFLEAFPPFLTVLDQVADGNNYLRQLNKK